MEFRQYFADPATADLKVWFFATIEGLPYVFTTAGMDTVPSGFRPTGYSTATVKTLLKTGQGFRPVVEEASRRKGVAQVQEIPVSLGPDTSDGFLRTLFAYRPTGLQTTHITDTVGWTDTTISVASTAGFGSTGTIYIGREAITYTGVNATSFTGCTRGASGSAASSYVWDEDLHKGSVYVRSAPINFEGRLCRVWMGLLDHNGAAVSAVDPWPIFGGPISSMPTAADWVTWTFGVRDVGEYLNTEIGGYKIQGRLLAGTADAGLDSTIKQQWNSAFIETGVNDIVQLSVVVTEYSLTIDGTPEVLTEYSEDVTITIDPGYTPNLGQDIGGLFLAELVGGDLEDVVQLYFENIEMNYGTSPYQMTEKTRKRMVVVVDATELPGAAGDIYKYNLEVTLNASSSSSALAMLGFGQNEFYEWSSAQGQMNGAVWENPGNVECKFSADEPPTMYRLAAGSRYLPVIFDGKSESISQSVPASGTVSINEAEVTTYSALDDVTPWLDNMRILTLSPSERGLMGTKAVEYSLQWQWVDNVWQISETDVLPVKIMWGLIDTDLLTLILTLAISTGGNRYTSGDYEDYDTASVGEWQGAAIPGPMFDLDSFSRERSRLGTIETTRSFMFAEPINLRDFIDRQLSLLGLCLIPRPTPDGFALSLVDTTNICNQWLASITLDEDGNPEIAEGSGNVVTPAGMNPEDRLRITHDIEQVINAITIRPMYDCAAEKQLETKVTYNDVDSQIEYGLKRSMELDIRGLGAVESVAVQIAEDIAPGILARFSRRYPLYTFFTTRAAWQYSPGDQVVVSFPGVPNEAGGRGIDSQTLTILRIEKAYFDPAGHWACKIVGVGAMDGNYSYYAPASGVASKGTDGTGNYLSLNANDYSTTTEPNPYNLPASDVQDLLWFAGATKLRIYNRGAEDVDSEVLTVATAGIDLAASKIYVDALPSLTVGTETRLTFADWDEEDLAPVQMQFAFIADNDRTLTDYDSEESDGFRYL